MEDVFTGHEGNVSLRQILIAYEAGGVLISFHGNLLGGFVRNDSVRISLLSSSEAEGLVSHGEGEP